ncbi:tetratricopeptide repeat protein, partial [bacterium]|nr:tetratricopeptide repeat protein [bacterium]
MHRIILFFIVAFLMASANFAQAAMDYVLEDKIKNNLSNLEELYGDGKWSEAIELARKIMGQTPVEHPAKQRARDVLILSIDKKALQTIELKNAQIREQNQKAAQKFFADGTALLGEKKYKEARSNFQQALQCSPEDPEINYSLGYSEQQIGNNVDAYFAYKTCVKLQPTHYQALFHLAELSSKLKRYGEAEEFAQRLTVSIENRIKDLKSLAYEQKIAGFNDKAISTIRKISSLKHDQAQAFYLLGTLTERRGEFNEAIVSLKKSIALAPHKIDAYFHLGRVYLKTKTFHQASLSFEQALLLGETSMREEKYRGEKLLGEGKSDEAVASGLRSKDLEQRVSLTWYYLALCAWKRNDMGSAQESIDKSLELKPNFLKARFANSVFFAGRHDYQGALYEMRQ